MNPFDAIRRLTTPPVRSTGRVAAVMRNAVRISTSTGFVQYPVTGSTWRVGDRIALVDGVPVMRLRGSAQTTTYWV